MGATAGKPVGDIFIENGEEAFRELERSAATSALGALREHGGVLALGSGAVLDAGIQALLDGLPVVYLSADFGTVAHRIGLYWPLVVIPGNPRGRLRAMLDERDAIYQRLAALTRPPTTWTRLSSRPISQPGSRRHDRDKNRRHALRRGPAPPRSLWVSACSASCPA